MKEVEGYNGRYWVYPDGRVWSNYRQGRFLTPTPDKDGYLTVCLSNRQKQRTTKVHRLVALYYVGGYSEDLQVNHINGDKADNRAQNLEWVTLMENSRHAWSTGLKVGNRGSKHPLSKLTESDIPIIRERLASGDKGTAIANDFDVCLATISLIKSGKNWQHVQ